MLKIHRRASGTALLIAAVTAVASCAGPAPTPPSPEGSDAPRMDAATSNDAASTQRRIRDASRPRHYTPTGLLPAAAPISTFGPNGERTDPIVSLQEMLDAGDVVFSHDPVTGYLPSLLAALDIPISSQVLIFARTSLQTERIAPWAPRAVYFNDDVYVGHVSDDTDPMDGRIIEIASVDPDDGSAFYFLPQDPDQAPKFVREGQQCLMCHESGITEGIPGVMVRSVLTGRMGRVIIPVQEAPTTDRTPMEQRFSGWYVTGTHGSTIHGGNVYSDQESHELDLGQRSQYLDNFDFSDGSNVTDLTDRFDTSIYLSEHSDIVALLVLSHQTRVHNLITLAHEQTRRALREQDAARITRGLVIPEGELLATTEVAIDNVVDRLVREMLFSGALPLEGPVEGTSGFTEEFAQRGPFDGQGRTLREFELTDRLFRYPLSYLIYTDAFDALPELTRRRAYLRIDQILRGEDTSGDFNHLDAATRQAIREILVATKPDFEAALR